MIHPPSVPPGFSSRALELMQRVQRGMSPVELVYTDHERWPFRPGQTMHTRPTLRISILDSSFNPPTLAHLALANSPPPQHSGVSPEPYDARMLLLSVRNADKVSRPGDATFVQRLEMMHLLSHDVRSTDDASAGESSQSSRNIAVATIDEPTFVGKSTILLRFFRARLAAIGSSDFPGDINDSRDMSHPFPTPELTFLMGLDTLIRLFSPKYYPSQLAMSHMLRTFLSPDQEGSRLVYACRQPEDTSVDKALEVAHEFTTSNRIASINIGTEEQTYSSTQVRTKVASGDETWKRLVTIRIAQYIIKQGIYSVSEREQ